MNDADERSDEPDSVPHVIRLLNLFVKSVFPQSRIVLHLFQALWVCLEVLFSRVAGGRFSFLASLSAFQGDNTDFAFFLSHLNLPIFLKERIYRKLAYAPSLFCE